MGRQYKQSRKGEANFVHISQPDTKFNVDGLYHVDIIYSGDEAEAYRKEIDIEVEEALREHIKDMKPGEAKKWSAHYPYSIEEDPDTGAETGRIIFKFKQNAVIHMEDGTKKPITISVRDAKNKPTPTPIYSGDIIKVLYASRVTVATSNKTVGVRLDFCAAQIVQKKERSSGGFDEEPDGFEDDRADEGKAQQGQATDHQGEDNADY